MESNYALACAIEICTAPGTFESREAVERICLAAERHVDRTASAAAQSEQVLENLDVVYRLHSLIGGRHVTSEQVTKLFEQMQT